jgi:hypothetical protein
MTEQKLPWILQAKQTFFGFIEATPFSWKKRPREESAVEHPEEPSPKRPAAPGSTKKTLQFQPVQEQRGGRTAGQATGTAALITEVAPLAQQQEQLRQQKAAAAVLLVPPLSQPAAKLRRLGEGLVKQAARPPTAYNSPQPGVSRQVFPSLTRAHTAFAASYTPARSSRYLLGSALNPRATPATQRPGVLQSSLKLPVGQATLLAQVRAARGWRLLSVFVCSMAAGWSCYGKWCIKWHYGGSLGAAAAATANPPDL